MVKKEAWGSTSKNPDPQGYRVFLLCTAPSGRVWEVLNTNLGHEFKPNLQVSCQSPHPHPHPLSLSCPCVNKITEHGCPFGGFLSRVKVSCLEEGAQVYKQM